jgi:hypothetical protein
MTLFRTDRHNAVQQERMVPKQPLQQRVEPTESSFIKKNIQSKR